jgi:hypothetical protein
MNIRKMRSILKGMGYYEAVAGTYIVGVDGEVWCLQTTVEGSGGFRAKVDNTIYLQPRKGWMVRGMDWSQNEHDLEGYVADVLFVR